MRVDDSLVFAGMKIGNEITFSIFIAISSLWIRFIGSYRRLCAKYKTEQARARKKRKMHAFSLMSQRSPPAGELTEAELPTITGPGKHGRQFYYIQVRDVWTEDEWLLRGAELHYTAQRTS